MRVSAATAVELIWKMEDDAWLANREKEDEAAIGVKALVRETILVANSK